MPSRSQDRVFLSETLRSGDFVAETAPDPASGDELQTAYDQAQSSAHYRFDPVIRCIRRIRNETVLPVTVASATDHM